MSANGQSNRVYELRTYHAIPGKLEALEARFRDHTDRIFRQHNLNVIGYWTPESNPDNMLIYIIEHNSKDEAITNWAAFQADEAWKKVRAETEAGGPLLTRPPEGLYMNPTDFSAMK